MESAKSRAYRFLLSSFTCRHWGAISLILGKSYPLSYSQKQTLLLEILKNGRQAK